MDGAGHKITDPGAVNPILRPSVAGSETTVVGIQIRTRGGRQMADQKTQTEGGKAAGLQTGEEAPDFRLPSTHGSEISLSQYRGLNHVLLVFLRGMT